MTIGSSRDLQELLRREHHIEGRVSPVSRIIRGLGYRDNRPRHDLTYRQESEAVAPVR